MDEIKISPGDKFFNSYGNLYRVTTVTSHFLLIENWDDISGGWIMNTYSFRLEGWINDIKTKKLYPYTEAGWILYGRKQSTT